MHSADFAQARLRELDEAIEETTAPILSGAFQDFVTYRQAVARRTALLEARTLIKDALDRDEARS